MKEALKLIHELLHDFNGRLYGLEANSEGYGPEYDNARVVLEKLHKVLQTLPNRDRI